MVKKVQNITSFSGNGIKDWLGQRVSALILGAYFVFILLYCLMHPGLDYVTWTALFHTVWMKIFSLFTLLGLLVHAWVGIWTVITDYIKVKSLRIFLEVMLILALLGLVIWGIQILWSIS